MGTVGDRAEAREVARGARVQQRSAQHLPGTADLLPASKSFLAPETLLAEIARTYAIGAATSCELLQPGANDTYLLKSGSTRYIARLYGADWRSLAEVRYELKLINHLAVKGVPVALPIADAQGRLVYSLPMAEGPRQLVLFTFAKGLPLAWDNPEHCALAGHVTATIHAAADDFATVHSRKDMDLNYLLECPMAMLRPYLADRPRDWEFLETLAGEVRARAEALIAGGLQWGVCHGDISSQNIRVAETRLDRRPDRWTAIDFDLSGPGWRVFDFVPAWRIAAGTKRPEVWDNFLRGYTQVRPVAAADLAAVPLFNGISRIWSFGMRARLVNQRGTAVLSGCIDSYLTFFRDWRSEMSQSHAGSL